MKKYPVSRKKDIVVQELDGEILIYDLKINKAFCLNETSALVWQLCDGTKSVGEISQSITGKFKSSVGEELVWLALGELKKADLLFNGEDIKTNLDSLSRREIIRKVGVGSLIALPLVSILVAPTAAQATSCLAENDICDGSVACCPGLACNPSCGQCVPAGGLGGCL